MKVLYESKVYDVIDKDGKMLIIESKNGERLVVEESKVIILSNLNEYL